MATYIRKLKDLHGSYVLPATRSAAIYMSNNQKLEDYLSDMEDDLMRQISSGSVDFSRATASTSDVLSGETFYAGNKTLKTGTLSLTATAGTGDVLQGKTFFSGNSTRKTGTMTNRGAWTSSVEAGGSITIPAGYHNGGGKVTASASSGILEFAVSIVSGGKLRKTINSQYINNGVFQKSCNVRIIAFTWASNDHQDVNVQLTGVGELISAYDNDLKYFRSVERDVTAQPGWTFIANASGYYQGVSGYVVYLQ